LLRGDEERSVRLPYQNKIDISIYEQIKGIAFAIPFIF